MLLVVGLCFFFKQKTAYEMRISDWSSDVCSSDLLLFRRTVDLVVRRELRPASLRKHLRDRSRQRRLAMVHMADRPDVAVRLRPLELCLRHDSNSSRRVSGHTITRRTATATWTHSRPCRPDLAGRVGFSVAWSG